MSTSVSSVPGKEDKRAWSVYQPVAEVKPAVAKGRVKNNIMPSSNLPFETMWGNLNGQTVIFWPHLCNT